MSEATKRRLGFLLRLPTSTRETAKQEAAREGLSLNHFIALAVAEKLARIEQKSKEAPKQTEGFQKYFRMGGSVMLAFLISLPQLVDSFGDVASV
jgi:hypothetical protein